MKPMVAILLALMAVFGCTAAPANHPVPRPDRVVATVGDVRLSIDGKKLWTIGHIEYRGITLGVEGSAYGTVVNIAKVGFIGSAHREVEPEAVTALRFFLDDRTLQATQINVRGQSFKVARQSRIRSFQLNSLLELRDDRLFQSVRMRATTDTDTKVIYPFMYAWTPAASDYLWGADDGTRKAGKFLDGKSKPTQLSQHNMDWLAVYDQKRGVGAVSRLLARPTAGKTSLFIVDAPKVYRKFYVMCFPDETVPAKFDGTYRMASGFFRAGATDWKVVASKMADSLKQSP